MAKVLSQLSSFLRVLPVPSPNLSEQLMKLEEKRYKDHCVPCHWDFNKCFKPNQTLFWRKEKDCCDQTIAQKIIYLTLLSFSRKRTLDIYNELFTYSTYVLQ